MSSLGAAILAFWARLSQRNSRRDRVGSGSELRIVAKIFQVDRDYWHKVVKPLSHQHRNAPIPVRSARRRKASFLG